MHQQILDFWFKELSPSQHWKKDPKFDQLLVERFTRIHKQAVSGELHHWRKSAQGRLAEIIVLDQFSRNMFRDSALAFANDAIALVLSQEAISAGAKLQLNAEERAFLYMPFMHSESVAMHELALVLFKENGIQSNLDFELRHKEIIDLFGRYPHRNHILGRNSTPAELEFLKRPGSGF
ncbi:MAG: DUF924 domain-containing protein [Pseudomonadales bacterium]|nr:DUF924 domain-containing protein [Pseudomonadales bacterium]